MATKIRRETKEQETVEDLINVINESDIWLLVTITAIKDANKPEGATVAVRESARNTTINTIAMLLEQPEIFDLVQKRMADMKLKEKPTDKTIN